MRLILLFLVFFSLASGLSAQNAPVWKLILAADHPDFGALQATHLPTDLLKELAAQEVETNQLKDCIKVFANEIKVEDFATNGGMLGSYLVEDTALLFKPRLPFIEGKKYQVIIDGAALLRLAQVERPTDSFSAFHHSSLLVPHQRKLAPAKVSAIYPSSQQIPANLLKCYIQFAQPMSLSSVYPHLHLLDESGTKIAAPFLELSPELWDPQRQRLTLWFDPGRIKSHLSPNQQMGAPLQTGRVYTLVVDTTFKDAFGQQLAAPFHQTFFTTPPDSIQPAIVNWDIVTPAAGGRGPLVILFPESMDLGVLSSSIAVMDTAEQVFPGEIQIGRTEKSWLFTPDAPWQSGKYILRISTDIEDVAGNNLERLFDTKLIEGEERTMPSEKSNVNYVQLTLTIPASSKGER